MQVLVVFLACIVGVALCQKQENSTKAAAAAPASTAVVPAEDMQAAASSYDKSYKPKAKKVYYGYGGYPSHYPGSSYDSSYGYGDSYGYQAPAYGGYGDSYGYKESYAPKSYDYKPKDYGYEKPSYGYDSYKPSYPSYSPPSCKCTQFAKTKYPAQK